MILSKELPTILLLLLSSSTLTVNGENPSGNCATDDPNNGGRPGYHFPNPTDSYLTDCQNPLNRELWRVFQKEDGTAYIIPRPDSGLAVTSGICTPGETSELDTKARKYGLCGGGEDSTTASLSGGATATTTTGGNFVPGPGMNPSLTNNNINSMDPVDALLFTNVFHRQLRFGMDPKTMQMIPFIPPDDDILAACALLADSTTSTLMQLDSQDYCSSIANRCNGDFCLEMAITPSPAAIHALVPALNAIYGIPEIGQTCIPSQWQGPDHSPVFGCPAVVVEEDCDASNTIPTGCQLVTGQFAITEGRDCCEKQCTAIDPTSGLSCSSSGQDEEVQQSCNPIITGTDPMTNCPPPVADCSANGPPLPDGCTYAFGFYALDGVGNCCERQCYAIDEDGNDCSVTTTNAAPSLTEEEDTTPQPPQPPPTETQKEEEDVTVDAASPQPEPPAVVVPELCTPQGDEVCPVVRCMGAPQGCQYKEDHYIVGGNGRCCPAACYLVDNDGNECTAMVSNAAAAAAAASPPPAEQQQQQQQESNASSNAASSSTEAARINTETQEPEEEECVPTGDEACPVARCASPPDGCEYKFDHYVRDGDGTCCPALCYAVDSDGNECSLHTNQEEVEQQETPDDTSQNQQQEQETLEDTSQNQQPGGGGDEDSEGKKEGDKCIPESTKSNTVSSSTTKQGSTSESTSISDNCPVADCAAEAPPGCSYVVGPFVINSVGDCCPQLCYSVDNNGNPCGGGNDDDEGEAAEEGKVTSAGILVANESYYYCWVMTLVVVTMAHYFVFGNN